MNRRTWGLALAVAAALLAILLLVLRSASSPAQHPVVVANAPETRRPPGLLPARLPTASAADAEKLPQPDAPRFPQRQRSRYDAQAVETVRGRVAMSMSLNNKVRQGASPERIVLESGGEQIIVRLGPPRGLRNIGFERLNLVAGDEVEVTGSRIAGPRRIIVAATVTKGDQTITLRDGNGEPAWIPPRRGPRQRQAD